MGKKEKLFPSEDLNVLKTNRHESPEKKERVFKIARKLFVEKGYYRVTIPDIVKASGVSTGAIYHYFANKENLAGYIHEKTLNDFQVMFSQSLIDKTTTYDKLRVFAELLFTIAENDPEMMEYMLFMKHREFLDDYPPICYTETFCYLRSIISEGMESGELKKECVFVAAISYTGVILRAVELRLRGVLKKPLADVAEDLIQNAWNAVKA
jgi:TetR/AcrR family transcriptional regulator, repressor of fatR-cypB operon